MKINILTAVPLFKQQLSHIQSLPSIIHEEPFDHLKFVTATKALATCTNTICLIFLDHRYVCPPPLSPLLLPLFPLCEHRIFK
jgi:hypothetical protein